MSTSFADRIKETTTSTGTGDMTLDGSATGFNTFDTGFGLDTMFTYCIVDDTTGEWETGKGLLTDSVTLERTEPESSNSGDFPVDFSAGTKTVFATVNAQRLSEMTPRLMDIAALPRDAAIVGSSSEPVFAVVASATAGNTHWTELAYDNSDREAFFTFSPVDTATYAGGSLRFVIYWFAGTADASVEWAIRLRYANTSVDITPSAEHSLVCQASQFANGLTMSIINVTPDGFEPPYGLWCVGLKRNGTSGGDTFTGTAHFVCLRIEEQTL